MIWVIRAWLTWPRWARSALSVTESYPEDWHVMRFYLYSRFLSGTWGQYAGLYFSTLVVKSEHDFRDIIEYTVPKITPNIRKNRPRSFFSATAPGCCGWDGEGRKGNGKY